MLIAGSAFGFDHVVTLGDSLLDDLEGIRSPVAAEHVASRLGVPLIKFAEFGATSAEMIADGQHLRAAADFGAGDLAMLWIGGNDFFENAVGVALGSQSFLDDLSENAATAIETLRASGIDVVAMNLPDFSKVPVIQETVNSVVPLDFLRQAALNNFRNLTLEWNARLNQIAAANGAAVVDVFGVVDQLWDDPQSFSILSHEPVFSHDWGCQFCVFADVAHPSSYAQGYIANSAMSLIDDFFNTPLGVPLTPLTSVEIALLADLLAGDFNESGLVDATDLADWTGGFSRGSPTHPLHADGDADGNLQVDGTDFLWWQRQHGVSLASSAAQSVPEPGTLALVLSATLAWASASRRRRCGT